MTALMQTQNQVSDQADNSITERKEDDKLTEKNSKVKRKLSPKV